MEQLTKNQAVAASEEAVQNQNEPQLRDENSRNDKSVLFFFFQAEDGIRDLTVTGVQTCALPIFTLLIHTHVREDALALFGFVSAREKHFFELLISASGVGPSLALKILSGMRVEELVPAIRGGDLVRLTKIPGVGRKTAERIVVELKDKLEAVAIETEKPAAASGAGVEADVVSALVNLGYDTRTAE